MVKSLQTFFLILKNLELHKAQFEVLQNIKKTLHVIKELIKNFSAFTKAYFQKILKKTRNSHFCVTPKNHRLMFV